MSTELWDTPGLSQGLCPLLAQRVRSPDDCPFGIGMEDLASAHHSPAGPWCVPHRAQGEEGRAGLSVWRDHPDGCAVGEGDPPPPRRASVLLPSPPVTLPLPLKTIWRIITFIMSFIMGDSSSCLKINAGLRNYIWYMEAVCM